jgi:hypothetical protein
MLRDKAIKFIILKFSRQALVMGNWFTKLIERENKDNLESIEDELKDLRKLMVQLEEDIKDMEKEND